MMNGKQFWIASGCRTGVIGVIGVLLMVLGLLAAVPLVFCITGAAYRQLFGSDDRAEFLKGQ